MTKIYVNADMYARIWCKARDNAGRYNTQKYRYFLDSDMELYRLPKNVNDPRELRNSDDFVKIVQRSI